MAFLCIHCYAIRTDYDCERGDERSKPEKEGKEEFKNDLGAAPWAVDTTLRSLLRKEVWEMTKRYQNWSARARGNDSIN